MRAACFPRVRRRRSVIALAAILSPLVAMGAPALAKVPEHQEPTIKEAPVISGAATVGSSLTASKGSWRPHGGTASYQWLRCKAGEPCAEIPGASALKYTVTGADVGHSLAIRLVVTWDDDDDVSRSAVSAQTAVVPEPAQPPAVTAAPSVTGDAVEGELLVGDVGTWSGTAPLELAYEWLRCDVHGGGCESVAGSDRVDYRLAADDVGHTLRFRVTATNTAGTTSAASAPTVVIAPQSTTPSPSPSPSPTPAQSPAPGAPATSTPAATSPSSTGVTAPSPRPVAPAPALRPPLMRPFPVVRIAGRFNGARTTFALFTVTAPRSAAIRLTCRGRGCPFRRRAVAAALVTIRRLQRTFLAGTVIEVRVTAPGVIGAYTRITVRRGRSPARLDRCLYPGSPREPRRCPAA